MSDDRRHTNGRPVPSEGVSTPVELDRAAAFPLTAFFDLVAGVLRGSPERLWIGSAPVLVINAVEPGCTRGRTVGRRDRRAGRAEPRDPPTEHLNELHPITVLDPSAEAAAQMLDDHDDLSRPAPGPTAAVGRPAFSRGGEQLLILLDTETTGFESRLHEIVELAMLAVIHDADGLVLGVAEEFSALREPSTPLPAAATAITGFTAEMLAGQPPATAPDSTHPGP